MADPERFDTDPDPSFQADMDPDPDPDPKFFKARERKLFLSPDLNFFFSIILQNFSCIIFSVTMREEGRGVRDKV